MTEAELLFTEILDCNKLTLFLKRDSTLDRTKSTLIASALKRRIRGEPLDYILGRREFFGLEFKVNKNVFIPRPETEILIETALKIAHSSKFIVHSILDIGTGSGCIAVSLAVFLKDAKIAATDISKEALEMAKQNALLNKVEINFLQSNLFSNYELRTTNYQLIVSNPPYIPTYEIDKLQPEIGHEPRIALDGGNDGLDFYRRIITLAPNYLEEGGFLILEMGFGQSKPIQNIFKICKKFEIIEVVKDYNDIDRVIIAKFRCGFGITSSKPASEATFGATASDAGLEEVRHQKLWIN